MKLNESCIVACLELEKKDFKIAFLFKMLILVNFFYNFDNKQIFASKCCGSKD